MESAENDDNNEQRSMSMSMDQDKAIAAEEEKQQQSDADMDTNEMLAESETEVETLQLQFEALEGELSACDLCMWSPDGRQFAVATSSSSSSSLSSSSRGGMPSSSIRKRPQETTKRGILRIIDRNSLAILAAFVTTKPIKKLRWSPTSESIAVLHSSEDLVEIFSVYALERVCGISEDGAKIVGITWSPDSKFLITVPEFGLFSNVWNVLKDPTIELHLPGPTGNPEDALSFSPDSALLAVLTKSQRQFFVMIYAFDSTRHGESLEASERKHVTTWDLVSSFQPRVQKPVSLFWSPDAGRLAIVNDNIKFGISFHFLDGSIISDIRIPSEVLGVSSLLWISSTSAVVIRMDLRCELWNFLEGQCLFSYSTHKVVKGSSTNLYVELPNNEENGDLPQRLEDPSNGEVNLGKFYKKNSRSYGKRSSRSHGTTLNTTKSSGNHQMSEAMTDTYIAAPTAPVILPWESKDSEHIEKVIRNFMGKLWSPAHGKECTAEYFAMVVPQFPQCVWIYDVRNRDPLSVIVLANSVTSIEWDSSEPRLLIASRSDKVFVWEKEGFYFLDVNDEGETFSVGQIIKSPSHPQQDTMSYLVTSKKKWKLAKQVSNS